MAKLQEPQVNNRLAELLSQTRHAWRQPKVVRSENTDELFREPGKKPDIIIVEDLVAPVVIETEYAPALTVEEDAKSRLGKVLIQGGQILSALAVKLPQSLSGESMQSLPDALRSATFEVAALIGDSPSSYDRLPESGWLRCGLAELSVLAQSLSLPPALVEKAAGLLEDGVRKASDILDSANRTHPGATDSIAADLKQENGEQTRRMAATILANAFVFHGTLAGRPGALKQVKKIKELKAEHSPLGADPLIAEWDKILEINYWPIFDIAKRILLHIPDEFTVGLIATLDETSSKLLQSRLMRSHDLTGAVFQRMIADRKFLAAFYTRPASASLLINLVLTIDQPLSKDGWGDPEKVSGLRIADFACGTGTLLSTAYQRIGQLHELQGGNSEAVHPQMMAESLIGCDVLPAAAHLTASMLAGVHPAITYEDSRIDVVEYGVKERQGGKSFEVKLGSLDWLQDKARLLGVTTKRIAGSGSKETHQEIPDSSLDAILMNPPFTRQTGHHEYSGVEVMNPMYAAFNSTEEDQKRMAAAVNQLCRGTSAHGNAGEASMFLALADRKLALGGVLGLVMPLSLISGDAWEGSRLLLRKYYADLIIVSISGAAGKELSFSADTGMGECLVIARKDNHGCRRANFVVLKERPESNLLGLICAEEIDDLIRNGTIRKLEDGPLGGTPLHFGNTEIGWILDAPLPLTGGWNLSRIADLSLAQTAYQQEKKGKLWLPTTAQNRAAPIPMTTLEKIGSLGPLDRDVNGAGSKGSIRGPFDIVKIDPNLPVNFPVLWSHDAKRERTIRFPHDSEARQKVGKDPEQKSEIERRAQAVWSTRTHLHFNRDFRFNSQSTVMQFTPDRVIGGCAWPSIRLKSEAQEKAMALWANSTLGILMYWWYANKQQMGRGRIVRTVLRKLPVLDVTALTSTQLDAAATVFDETCELPLLPAYQLDKDEARHLLDERLFREVLNLPESLFHGSDSPLALLRRKLAAEPSIHGHKK